MPRVPHPDCEDLFPHVSQVDDPGNEMHGEMALSPVALGLLIAPDVEEFSRVWTAWHDEQQRKSPGAVAARGFELPAALQKGARRRSSELKARYNASDMVTVLRGLRREYGPFPQTPGF